MAIRETTPAGSPVWTDIMCSDVEASKEFYAALFGWEFEEPDAEAYGGYFSATRNGRLVAGFSPYNKEFGGVPDHWMLYLATGDINETEQTIVASGGTTVRPAMHVKPYGHMGIYKDNGGVEFGLWQPETRQGFGLEVEHGAPAWHEVLSRNYESAMAFYARAFDWDMHTLADTPQFRYSTYGLGDEARAGIMDAAGSLPTKAPGFWRTYWGVDDVDLACKEAVSRGGEVTEAPQDSEFGRVAGLTDCCGAAFKIIGTQPPAA